MPGTTVNGSRNAPLRGSKRTTLEGGIRVPFVVSWPGRVKPGVFDQPAIQLDLHATALAAAGVEAKPEWKLDGVNLLPFLRRRASPAAPHDALYWRFGAADGHPRGRLQARPLRQQRRHAHRRPQPAGHRRQALQPRRRHRRETKDLAAAMPEKVKELQAKWDAWNARLVPPLWGDGAGPGSPAKKGKKARADKK